MTESRKVPQKPTGSATTNSVSGNSPGPSNLPAGGTPSKSGTSTTTNTGHATSTPSNSRRPSNLPTGGTPSKSGTSTTTNAGGATSTRSNSPMSTSRKTRAALQYLYPLTPASATDKKPSGNA